PASSSLAHFFLLIRPRPPPSPLFPYTTLFRSVRGVVLVVGDRDQARLADVVLVAHRPQDLRGGALEVAVAPRVEQHVVHRGRVRSEEHTSELQSRFDLVCRLLLEKKKQTTSLT